MLAEVLQLRFMSVLAERDDWTYVTVVRCTNILVGQPTEPSVRNLTPMPSIIAERNSTWT